MSHIKLIVLDVDGTLTDGRIIMGSDGTEYKSFNVKDGMGISLALKAGIEVGIITGRKSNIVSLRAAELGIPYVFQGVHNKLQKLEEFIDGKNIGLQNIAFIGDDINDLQVMKSVGYSACPADAVEEIRHHSDFVSKYDGGQGAVREIIEEILKEQQLLEPLFSDFRDIKQ